MVCFSCLFSHFFGLIVLNLGRVQAGRQLILTSLWDSSYLLLTSDFTDVICLAIYTVLPVLFFPLSLLSIRHCSFIPPPRPPAVSRFMNFILVLPNWRSEHQRLYQIQFLHQKFVRPDWVYIQCSWSARVSCCSIMKVGGMSRFCVCGRPKPQRTLYMSALISLHLPLSLSLSYISPISARPPVLYLLQISVYSNSLSLSSFFLCFPPLHIILSNGKQGKRDKHKNSVYLWCLFISMLGLMYFCYEL